MPVDLLTSAHVVEGADTAFTDGTTGRKSGLPVAQVMPQSPAAQSGLHVGDIVVSVAGEPIGSTTALQRTMVEDPIGRRLEITVWRNGALVDVIAVPAS